MKNKHLNHHIKDYYQEQGLSPEKMDSLVELTNSSEHNSRTSRRTTDTGSKRHFQNRVAIAASILVLLLLTMQWLPVDFYGKKSGLENLAYLVSEEIALNHNKQLSIEYSASNFKELRAQMEKLDFTPVASTRLEGAGLKFIGARYCSIQGQLAAQIKLVDKEGRTQTLYQTQLTNKLKELDEQEYYVDGVKIKQWQEKGLFFGLAVSEN